MLKTRNIYIDTQAFVSNNYFQNENLKRLAEMGQQGIVQLYISEITIEEIKSNLKEELHNATIEINKFMKSMSSKAKIVKNLDSFRPYLMLPKLDLDMDFLKLSGELDNFIKAGNVKIIPLEGANLREVVDKYFKGDKPFGKGKKKHEFPDAIVLSALENWCKPNNTIYLLSGDKDFYDDLHVNIFPVESLKTILGWINEDFSERTERTEWITNIYKSRVKEIEEKIKESFIHKLKDEIGFDIIIENLQILQINLLDFSIVEESLMDSDTTFQIDYTISFKGDVTYDDYSLSIYDKEDDRYYGYDQTNVELEFSSMQVAEITIEAYIEDGYSPEEADAIINCIDTSVPSEDDITEKLEGYIFTG